MQNNELMFTPEEKIEFLRSYLELRRQTRAIINEFEFEKMRKIISEATANDQYGRDRNGNSILLRNFNTALILSKEVGLDRSTLLSILLYNVVAHKSLTIEIIEKEFGGDVANIISHLIKTESLYTKHATVQSDNFRKLLLSFANDARVIIILIADNLCLMRMINHHPDNEYRLSIASEASYLYAPLAHRLGLYKIKSELEDLSLKYTNREVFNSIASKLTQTKEKRQKYIESFISPIRQKLIEEGFLFEMKGRTKSIYSIYNKMKKQKAEFEDIYDLFAIRIILDTPLEKEKADCWRIFSIIADMYKPNPSRMRDWLTIPKSNGYESLHITVWGPEDRWVEVQIRTKRMDEIAENGLAAHWRYKGVKSESGLDDWLNSMRDILESSDDKDALELVKDFSKDDYDKEVFVFSPKGDLYKLTKGATVLDFAYLVHTNIGNKCVGAKVDEKNQSLRYQIKSGDTIEILTSPQQKPKQDWLNIATQTRTKQKIRQALKEAENREAEYGKEMFFRRLKNRKIELDEAALTQLIKKLGFKTATKFFSTVAQDKIDINATIDKFVQISRENDEENIHQRSAEDFIQQTPVQQITKEDVLVIDGSLKDIEYKLSKCCNPIYGDEIFGFVNSQGGIKIHRMDCPNAVDLRGRFGYRVVPAKWSGKHGSQYVVVLRVVGNDDIGIVTNITSIISKESGVVMRSISIDSNDGLFQGHITVMVSHVPALNSLIKKLKTVKGVKNVERTTE
ncbi:MAG: bifunctional (p)ppGpp synthetase/guanosine-3',5'-bis(diphosphate) 3'-pyrophosphohydrolase [Bacteroidales bacterium]|nr:bifunctional (p)ppGpp synthetase/guanosine-3',5'-bis(diphosphate) 3'-pyrophosphohydrolase [Bacteroidales bacterium]